MNQFNNKQSGPIRPRRLDFSILKGARKLHHSPKVRKVDPITLESYTELFLDAYEEFDELLAGDAQTSFDHLPAEVEKMLSKVYEIRSKLLHDMLNYGTVKACIPHMRWLAKLYQALLQADGCWNVYQNSFPKV